MNCPTCGRALSASASRCVYCGQGSRTFARPKLNVPSDTLPPRRRTIRWGRWVLVLILGAVAAAAYLHPRARDVISSSIGWLRSR